MKKKRLRERIEQLESDVASLRTRLNPKQCEECGVLFAEKPQATMSVTSFGSFGATQIPQPEVRVVDGNIVRITYIQTRELCSRCKAEQQAKSA